MTFRIVFQTDLEVCCIEPDVKRDNRGSSFSKMQFLEESALVFTVFLSQQWMVVASERKWKALSVSCAMCCIYSF